jgi:predicted PurR-regulated permease PerM
MAPSGGRGGAGADRPAAAAAAPRPARGPAPARRDPLMPESSVRRITWRSADVARIFAMGMVFLFLWQFFWMVISAVFLTLLGVLIAIVLHLPARRLTRWMPFRVAYPLVVLTFLGGIAGLLVALIPEVVQQFRLLAAQLPHALEEGAEWFRRETGASPDSEVAANITQQAAEFAGRFVPIAFNAVTTLLGSFVVLVLAVFFGAQPALYRSALLGLVPEPARERWARAYDEAGHNLRIWVVGKAITMVAVGVCTYAGLAYFDIPGALALGALAALLEFIPNFGPTIAAIPAIIAAFSISPMTAVYVTLYYFILQQIQSALTVPLVERRAVNIPPALLLVWQLMLAIGFGILALFVATPLLAVILPAVRVLYLEPREELGAWDRRDPSPAAAGTAEAVRAEPPPPAPPPPTPEPPRDA